MLPNKLTFKVVTSIIYVCNIDHILCLAGSGIMDCGVGMQNYILIQIWYTQSVLVIIVKIGFLLRFPGVILLALILFDRLDLVNGFSH
jgi:hypothetical protein